MKILFISDFDGTINKRDLSEELTVVVKQYPDLQEKISQGKIGTPEIYRRLFNHEGLSVQPLKDFYIEQAVVDEYFTSFLDFIKCYDASHVIMSDGFDTFIEGVLKKAGIDESIPIFANKITDYDNRVTIDFPYSSKECDLCGVCKLDILKAMRPYFDRVIYIGNGLSDTCAVKDADIVFAHSTLKTYCNDNKIPAFYYNDYRDIINRLKKPVKGIIFDLDGTLIDSYGPIYESFNYAMRKLNLPEYSYEAVLKTIGLPIEDVMSGIKGIEDIDSAIMLFRENYEKIYLDKTVLLKDVKETLSRLYNEGYTMAVSTNKRGESARNLMKKLGISEYLKYVIGIGDGLKGKPYPDTVVRIIKELNLEREQTVYVGDSTIDIETARNAGIDVISIATGPADFKELAQAGPDLVIDQLNKLPLFVKPMGDYRTKTDS